MKQIGIIGAGAAGLCAAKHLLSKEGFIPTVWEHGSDIGGTWIYTPNIGLDENGYPIHSSMYKSLKTNLPKEIMAFPDFPFREGDRSFIHHTEVLQYLNDYAENFNLRPSIKFHHHVDLVEPVDKENRFTRWKVSLKNLKEGTSFNVECDMLIVCNGHYSTPKMADVIDKDLFKGFQMHSHDYRVPDPFEGRRVVVLGASASGMDISLEVAKVADKVYLSHNFPAPIPSDLPPNLRQVKGVIRAKPDGFILKDSSFVDADAIIYCTGYEYTFPFLSPSCGVTVEENQVKPLYKHLIHSTFPTLAIVGIPFQICPFPIFDVQVRYLVGVFEGTVTVPHEDTNQTHVVEPADVRHYHQFGSYQWLYMTELLEAVRDKMIPPYYKRIWDISWYRRIFTLTEYKQYSYSVEGAKESSTSVVETRKGKVVNTRVSVALTSLKQGIKFVIFNGPTLFKLAFNLGCQKLRRAFA